MGKRNKQQKPQVRYADVLEQIALGNLWSVYIDDTGPGGTSASPATLPHDRETHVAAILPPDAGMTLMREMPDTLEELRTIGGEHEFHFSRIYSGSGPYRQLTIARRLAIFEFFAEIATEENINFLVQSIDATVSANVLQYVKENSLERFGPFDPRKNKDLSLWFLLLKVRAYLENVLTSHERAAVFMDEGWAPNGRVLRLPSPWDTVLYEGYIMSARSDIVWGLQLADFAGFVLNRSQLLLGKDSLSDLDKQFLEIASGVAHLYRNLSTVTRELEADIKEESNSEPDAS